MNSCQLKEAKEDLWERGIEIDALGNGYMVSDYSGEIPSRFGAKYCGADGTWNDQPRCDMPFSTEEQAVKFAIDLKRPKVD